MRIVSAGWLSEKRLDLYGIGHNVDLLLFTFNATISGSCLLLSVVSLAFYVVALQRRYP